jgi:hypothetical protein
MNQDTKLYSYPRPVGPQSNVRNVLNEQSIRDAKSLAGAMTLNIREPSSNNPMMNVPVTSYDMAQIYDDYYRYNSRVYPSPKTEQVRSDVSESLLNGLYQDPSDKLFDRNNSQRQWYTMPVGGNTPDTVSFAENLYGVENVCKAGSIWARFPVNYTDDSLACTGYNAATPTNFGTIR